MHHVSPHSCPFCVHSVLQDARPVDVIRITSHRDRSAGADNIFVLDHREEWVNRFYGRQCRGKAGQPHLFSTVRAAIISRESAISSQVARNRLAARVRREPLTFYNCGMTIPFADLSARVQEHLERHYAIPVVMRDIPDPLTGDLNGAEIDID